MKVPPGIGVLVGLGCLAAGFALGLAWSGGRAVSGAGSAPVPAASEARSGGSGAAGLRFRLEHVEEQNRQLRAKLLQRDTAVSEQMSARPYAIPLQFLNIPVVSPRGRRLSAPMAEFLELTPEETAAVNAALGRYYETSERLDRERAVLQEASEDAVRIEIAPYPEEGQAARETLMRSIDAALDPESSATLKEMLERSESPLSPSGFGKYAQTLSFRITEEDGDYVEITTTAERYRIEPDGTRFVRGSSSGTGRHPKERLAEVKLDEQFRPFESLLPPEWRERIGK